ncbi:MAG: hypothetical protein KDK76_07860 [Chlamydiia bacterium]|nr:hypothetical protein [Chlamydiia bacterium]
MVSFIKTDSYHSQKWAVPVLSAATLFALGKFVPVAKIPTNAVLTGMFAGMGTSAMVSAYRKSDNRKDGILNKTTLLGALVVAMAAATASPLKAKLPEALRIENGMDFAKAAGFNSAVSALSVYMLTRPAGYVAADLDEQGYQGLEADKAAAQRAFLEQKWPQDYQQNAWLNARVDELNQAQADTVQGWGDLPERYEARDLTQQQYQGLLAANVAAQRAFLEIKDPQNYEQNAWMNARVAQLNQAGPNTIEGWQALPEHA